MKDSIIKFRSFLLAHIKNPSLQTLIKGLISYEMLTYVFFGIGTAIVDYLVFTFFNAGKVSALIANIISTFCAIIFFMSQISDGCSKVRPAVLWKFYMSFCALPEPV